jgi:hypothetical protein
MHVLALVMIPDNGWLTSCAIDAVNAPRLITRATCASSERALCLCGEQSLIKFITEAQRTQRTPQKSSLLRWRLLIPLIAMLGMMAMGGGMMSQMGGMMNGMKGISPGFIVLCVTWLGLVAAALIFLVVSLVRGISHLSR